MKTLKSIQLLSKAGLIISKIIFICCIVGFCGCLAGIVSLALGAEMFKIGDITVHGIIETETGINVPNLYVIMAAAMVLCVAEAVLCKFAQKYFKNELEDGTPFTMRGAKELLRLGILAIIIPSVASCICSIGIAIANHFLTDIKDVPLSDFSSFGIGITMIILSLFCRYAAELTEEKNTREQL